MDTTNAFEIPYVDPGDPQRDFPPLNKRAMEIIDSALFEQADAIQDLDAAIGTTETAITAERAARETAILAEQTARAQAETALTTSISQEASTRAQADTALTTALAGKVSGTGMTLRRDTTVGTRVLLDHPDGTTMLMGETPTISAIPYIINDWKQWGTFPLTLRRVGNRVYLSGMIDGTDKTANAFLQPPVGYRPASARTYPGIGIGWNTNVVQKTSASTTQISADSAPAGQYNFTIEWDTADPWPTT